MEKTLISKTSGRRQGCVEGVRIRSKEDKTKYNDKEHRRLNFTTVSPRKLVNAERVHASMGRVWNRAISPSSREIDLVFSRPRKNK